MQIKNINDVKETKLFGNSNFDNIIEKSQNVLEKHKEEFSGRNMDIGDTPISPMSLDDEYTPILLSGDVMEQYRKLVMLINNSDTAKEYSYVLLGKKCILAGELCYLIDKFIDCNSDELSSRITHIDNEKLNDAISFAMQNGYNFISLGHTHPNIPEEERKNTVSTYLSEDTIKSEYIREPGLNLSLQDFISYESLYQYFINNPNIRTCQTVIMYNGEMTMFSKQNDNLSRFTVILDSATGEPIYVSSKDEVKDNGYIL